MSAHRDDRTQHQCLFLDIPARRFGSSGAFLILWGRQAHSSERGDDYAMKHTGFMQGPDQKVVHERQAGNGSTNSKRN